MTPQRNLVTLEELKLEFVRQVIVSRLLQYDGMAGRAATSLGISRNTMWKLMAACEVNLMEIREQVRRQRARFLPQPQPIDKREQPQAG